MLVSFIIVTLNRKTDLKETLESVIAQNYRPIEVVVVDNNSSDGTDAMISEHFDLPFLRYIRLDQNRGVCGGRNTALQYAHGDIVITLDDDAVLENPDITAAIVEKFTADAETGALAFRSLNYYNRKLQKREFPALNKNADDTCEFETTWFIGVGHAVKKQVYNDVGLYRECYFPYGHEELDLSFRIVNAGYKILYFPTATVLHKVTDAGRTLRKNDFYAVNLEHRLTAALLNLPWLYVLTTTVIWVLTEPFLRSKGSVAPVFTALNNLLGKAPHLISQRRPISPDTVTRLKKLKGRLLY